MKRFAILALCSLLLLTATAQTGRWKGVFYNKEQDLRIQIDLYDTTVVATNYPFLGKLNGYLTGDIYDAWFLTTFEFDSTTAVCRFSNDLGSETQTIKLTFQENGTLLYETKNGNAIRKAVQGKWVKVPSELVFVRRK